MKELTKKQCYWLVASGGRRKKDVIWEGGEPFVIMYDGYNQREYARLIPDDKDIPYEMRVREGKPYVSYVGGLGYKLED